MYLGGLLRIKIKRARIIQRSEIGKLRTKSSMIRQVGHDSSRLHLYFRSCKMVVWINTDTFSHYRHIECGIEHIKNNITTTNKILRTRSEQ